VSRASQRGPAQQRCWEVHSSRRSRMPHHSSLEPTMQRTQFLPVHGCCNYGLSSWRPVKMLLPGPDTTRQLCDLVFSACIGRSLMVGSRPLQLWPLLLCKAILKVMAVYRSLDMTLPHQVRTAREKRRTPPELNFLCTGRSTDCSRVISFARICCACSCMSYKWSQHDK
jgi:hypothetical protein